MRSSRFILGVLSLTVFILAMTGCSRASDDSVGDTGLSPSQRVTSSSGASSSATDSPAVKQPNAVGTTAPGGNVGTGSGTAPAPAVSSSGTSAKPGAKSGMTVKILFWNDTSSKKLKGTQIRIGSFTFKPSTSAKQARGSLGPVAYDKKIELVVYPDGPTGKKVVVPLTVNRQMVSNSEQDGIHVAISDGTVRVLGNPVINVDLSQPRF